MLFLKSLLFLSEPFLFSFVRSGQLAFHDPFLFSALQLPHAHSLSSIHDRIQQKSLSLCSF